MANLQQKYIDLGDASPVGRGLRGLHGGRVGGQVRVAAMGIREAMPKGMISHGGPGSGFPFLLMLLHDELQRRRAQDPALVEGILGLLLAELAKSSAIANEGADPWGAHNPGLEAARMVGYEDALYFSRLFEKRYGKSPRFYREDMKDSARPTRQQW